MAERRINIYNLQLKEFFPLILSFVDSDYDETLASMQCGNKAKLVENAVKRNEVLICRLSLPLDTYVTCDNRPDVLYRLCLLR